MSKKCSKCGGPREPGRYFIGNSWCRACVSKLLDCLQELKRRRREE